MQPAIQTDRLDLYYLNKDELQLYLQGHDKFETANGIMVGRRIVNPNIVRNVLDEVFPLFAEHPPEMHPFFTFWIIVHRSERLIVGELGCKGVPNEEGEVEIEYGTFVAQRRKGYMKEAVGALIQWLSASGRVKRIVASIEPDNAPSIAIVKSNGFTFKRKTDLYLWWELWLH
jgi:[ribosomal protein S5]-alanine N-acetyltransferase